MAAPNRITGVVAGQYGVVIPLTILNPNGQAMNLAAYTGVTVKAFSPDAQTTLTFTGTIANAASGIVNFTPDSGNFFTRDGDWPGQVQLTAVGVFAPTVPFIFEVSPQL